MSPGALAVVEEWLAAVNSGNRQRLHELSAEDVEIIGPRGSAHGREMLADWMGRAGFSAAALRWFCGAVGNVVVEQDGRWSDPATGTELGRARVASHFAVSAGTVARYQRFDNLATALASAGLSLDDEVSSGLGG
jgi:hypothetical protein